MCTSFFKPHRQLQVLVFTLFCRRSNCCNLCHEVSILFSIFLWTLMISDRGISVFIGYLYIAVVVCLRSDTPKCAPPCLHPPKLEMQWFSFFWGLPPHSHSWDLSLWLAWKQKAGWKLPWSRLTHIFLGWKKCLLLNKQKE